jgi:GYF domain 2/TIR domain
MADLGWYFRTADGKEKGPFSVSDLKKLAAADVLQPTDQVWTEGMPEWRRASQVTGLFHPSPPPASQTVPTILVKCQCGRSYHLKAALAGKRVKCRECGEQFVVPPASSAGDRQDAQPSSSDGTPPFEGRDVPTGHAFHPPRRIPVIASTEEARSKPSSCDKIFISYRRTDSNDATDRLYEHLAAHFGRNAVFKDVDRIPPGVDFHSHLGTVLRQCEVVLVVIGDHWLNAQTPAGARRLDASRDYVRIEIETALRRGIPVIPVLVGSARMPTSDDLPASIQGLARRHAIELRAGRHYREDLEGLIQAIQDIGVLPDPTLPVSNADEHTPAPAHWLGDVVETFLQKSLREDVHRVPDSPDELIAYFAKHVGGVPDMATGDLHAQACEAALTKLRLPPERPASALRRSPRRPASGVRQWPVRGRRGDLAE